MTDQERARAEQAEAERDTLREQLAEAEEQVERLAAIWGKHINYLDASEADAIIADLKAKARADALEEAADIVRRAMNDAKCPWARTWGDGTGYESLRNEAADYVTRALADDGEAAAPITREDA